MIRSTDRIRTTHVGGLARPRALLDLMKAAAEGCPVDPAELAETERRAVADGNAPDHRRPQMSGSPAIDKFLTAIETATIGDCDAWSADATLDAPPITCTCSRWTMVTSSPTP